MDLPWILVSAWNDSGGGFLHRLLDGHPQLRCYPFELQLGTATPKDAFDDWFKAKYRWPVFSQDLDALSPDAIFDSFIDDELKSTVADAASSKFHDFPVGFDMNSWREAFRSRLPATGRSRASAVAAYVNAVFDVWAGRSGSTEERLIAGHCPVINLDADEIFADRPDTRFIHVLRSPVSGLVDMRSRRPEVVVERYTAKWNLVNGHAALLAGKYPGRFRVVRLTDLIAQRTETMESLCGWLAIRFDPCLNQPTWNGKPLSGLPPFGGVRAATLEHEARCRDELDQSVTAEITARTAGVAALLPALD